MVRGNFFNRGAETKQGLSPIEPVEETTVVEQTVVEKARPQAKPHVDGNKKKIEAGMKRVGAVVSKKAWEAWKVQSAVLDITQAELLDLAMTVCFVEGRLTGEDVERWKETH